MRELRKLKEDITRATPIDHISLVSMILNIENLLYDDYYQGFIADEGADGDIAGEIYRILSILEWELGELREMEKAVKKQRGKQKKAAGKLECPLCLTLHAQADTLKAIDGYRYCQDCSDGVKVAGGFDFDD